MSTITLYANKVNRMPGLLSDAKKAVKSYKSDLTSLKSKVMSIDRSVCNVENIISTLQSSTQTQEQKITSLKNFKKQSDEFIADTVRADNNVANMVEKRKDDFYDKFSYLKPECEKDWKEKTKDWFDSVGAWCKEHWKEIVIGIVCVVIGAILTAITGGAFLPTLLAGFKAAAIGALISGLISGGISLVISCINGDSLFTTCYKLFNSFADGFASGFMWGGIFAGGAMALSSCFKFAAKLGVTTGKNGGIGKKGLFKILSPDKIANDGNGGGTLIKIGKTLRLDVDTRILVGNKYLNPLKMANFLHMHIPKLSGNIPGLLIVGGHIPVGEYISILLGVLFKKKEADR